MITVECITLRRGSANAQQCTNRKDGNGYLIFLRVPKLRARDFSSLNVENLLEEIDALERSQRKELKSRLITLLVHLLKRLYIDIVYDNRGWELTIREQRKDPIAGP